MSASPPHEALVNLFAAKTVVDLPAIRKALGGKSATTASRQLKRLSYRRSYNHNGRYYARHIPERYDRFGLWSHGDVHFSVDGSLKGTVKRLVCEAEEGATQRSLQERLGVRVHNALLGLVRAGELHRSDINGLYVYFHADPLVRDAQLKRCRESVATTTQGDAEIDDGMVIRVLLVLIHHPGSTAAELVAHLRGHTPPIRLQHVEAVLTRYGLGEKRGALRS